MSEIAIKTTGLRKRYRSHLGLSLPPTLDGLSLNVREHEVFGFLGKNGAGKTTTIKILCGLVRQSEGEAQIFGHSTREKQARSLIGYLPESPYFYEYLTPRETMDFYGQLNGATRAERQTRWDYLSELLHLREIADQRVRDFSKGMRQRLGFAVALAGDPKLLILDEPMSGLDPMGRTMVRDLILRLRDEQKTIFFSSHILGDVEQVCDRVGMLVNGTLRREGALHELLTRETIRVDVLTHGVPEDLASTLRQDAQQVHKGNEGVCFSFATHEEADAAARQIYAAAGTILALTPISETLEEYFMRQQQEEGDAS